MTGDPAIEAPHASLLDRIRDRIAGWRDRLLLSPDFQRAASRFPPSRPIARHYAASAFDLCAGFVYSQVLFACVRCAATIKVRTQRQSG